MTYELVYRGRIGGVSSCQQRLVASDEGGGDRVEKL